MTRNKGSRSKGRRSLYLREHKDKDLIQYIDSLLDRDDFSDIVRDLMRDGIKYREKVEHVDVLKSNQIAHTPNKTSLKGVTITKKEVSKEELKERMDGFLESF